MTDIILHENWFAPGGRRMKKGLHKDVDPELLKVLPKKTKVIEDGESPPPVVEDEPDEDPKAAFTRQAEQDAAKLNAAENEAAETQNKAQADAQEKRNAALKAIADKKKAGKGK